MFKKKELEFKITDNNILNVSDFYWYIDKIDMIYIAPSCIDENKYAIYIATKNEIDKLHFETHNEADHYYHILDDKTANIKMQNQLQI